MKFVTPNDPVLLQVSEKVTIDEISSGEVGVIIDQMLRVAYGEQQDSKKPVMVGLAAPQVGISKRIILVDIAANGKGNVGNVNVYLNPEIISSSEEKK